MSSKKIALAFAIVCALAFTSSAFASLTISNTGIVGTAASTIDVGAGNALSLQTTNNGNVIMGTGYLGVGTATPGSPLNVTGITSTVTPITDLVGSTRYPVGQINASLTDATATGNHQGLLVQMLTNPSADWSGKTSSGAIIENVIPASNTTVGMLTLTGLNVISRHLGSGTILNWQGISIAAPTNTGAIATTLAGLTLSGRPAAGTTATATGVQTTIGVTLTGTATTSIGHDVIGSLSGTGSVGTLYLNRAAITANTATGGVTGTTYGYYVGDITTGTQTGGAYSFYNSDANAPSFFAGAVIANSALNKGTCVLGTSCATITVTSGAICTTTDTSAIAATRAVVSGTTLTITGTGTDTIAYTCL